MPPEDLLLLVNNTSLITAVSIAKAARLVKNELPMMSVISVSSGSIDRLLTWVFMVSLPVDVFQ